MAASFKLTHGDLGLRSLRSLCPTPPIGASYTTWRDTSNIFRTVTNTLKIKQQIWEENRCEVSNDFVLYSSD